MRASESQTKRILVYRLGSLGDTCVALPVFNTIRDRWPHAEISLLTNVPVSGKAAPAATILSAGGLVDDVMAYPVGTRDWKKLGRLWGDIRRRRFNLAINITAGRGMRKAWRDWLFLRSTGIPAVDGTPWRRRDQRVQYDPVASLYEHESSRLSKRVTHVAPTGIDLRRREVWDLHLTAAERSEAQHLLVALSAVPSLFSASVGTKVDAKDWGESNWQRLMNELACQHPDSGLVMLGAEDEYVRSQRCGAGWNGRFLNLAGRTSPRVSAAVLERATIFIGHDSGPMHLAATVGIPCVAVFAARNLPGQWFPYGTQHRVLYRKTDCFGCGLDVCTLRGKECILAIKVEDVLQEIAVVVGTAET